MQILCINSGSSSLKFKLYKTGKSPVLIAKGIVDGIGLKKCKFTFSSGKTNIGTIAHCKSHHEAVNLILSKLPKDIDAAGHRVVHGGEKFIKPVKIDTKVIKEIEKLIPLAPLHNPANLEGIKALKKLKPRMPQVAVFDTAFYQHIPQKAHLYGLPYDYYKKHGIKRYGFHGISHSYVIGKALKMMKKKNAKIISCHLGNGSSITAYDGKAVDTSMGFTPMEGVIMGTRCGSIDPYIPIFLEKNLKMRPDKVADLLNEESGLKGISGISSDMRDIYAGSLKKDKMALLAIDMLSYQIAKYIGGYAAALNGLDAIIFTGGIGEKAFYVREKVLNHLGFMGVVFDKEKNRKNATEIHTKKSKSSVFVIETNESLNIARNTEKTLKA